MTIFITGGSGFIGLNLINFLLKKTNYKIVNIDKLTYASSYVRSNLTKKKNYKLFKLDINNYSKLSELFFKYKPNAVIHLAAETHVDRSIDKPISFIKTNIFGTFNLLDVSYKYWKDQKKKDQNKFKFIHISTDEVFGDLGKTNKFFKEDTKYDPSSPYSASKASADHLVRAWNKTYGLPTIITNCSNNYGPYQFPEKLIPLTIINAKKGNKIPIYGKGNQKRDWLYVEDHVRAILLVLKKGMIGETYNIGGGHVIKNIDIVKEICHQLDKLIIKKPNNIKSFSKLIEFVEDRPGHDFKYAIDSSKIKNKLKWSPKRDLNQGLKETISWYLDNDEWIKIIQKKSNYYSTRLGKIHNQ